MNTKSAKTLEFPKVLAQLAQFTSFSAGRELAQDVIPTPDIDIARELQQETTEARHLLDNKPNVKLGGVYDVREDALSCERGLVLEGQVLLNIHSTLRSATLLRRTITRLSGQYPLLSEIADALEECEGLQEEIKRILDDEGIVKDSASVKLAVIRRDVRIAFDRLQTKINNIATSSSNAHYLQESIVTQRNGRYVIPLKAEFKGRIPGVVHDQSASGATLFIEPLSTVELNNRYRELQIEEDHEIRRILAELCELVAHEAERICRTVEGLAYLDLVFARAKYADSLDAKQPNLVPYLENMGDAKHPGSTIRLYQARHPLLPTNQVVPIDIEVDNDTYVLVITGPNTGGKTVALKTLGVLTLMSQCGMHLPTSEGSEMCVFEDIYADIGDEQSIEQSLSTFSSHMTNIIHILENANNRSLIILDELGAGTDPAEGSALARAILTYLLDRSITTVVTTHHPELKAFSYNQQGTRNASVEFDLETLRPTYRLIMGLPGRSNALAIASRLGLPDDIIQDARDIVGTEDLAIDNVLDEIHKTRDEIHSALERAQKAEAESRDLRESLSNRLNSIEQERRNVMLEAQHQADEELEYLRREIRHMRRQLEAAGQPLEAVRQLQQESNLMEGSAYISVTENEETPQPAETDSDRPFRLGDMVRIATLNSEGQVTEITEEEIEIMVGRLRVRAKPNELEHLSSKDRKKAEKKRGYSPSQKLPERGASPGLELDLRGSRIDDALPRVEGYLDAAYMAGLPFVRIIHGKGTGALRNAVRDVLGGHPLVSKQMSGTEKEGGNGVTIVHLVPQG